MCTCVPWGVYERQMITLHPSCDFWGSHSGLVTGTLPTEPSCCSEISGVAVMMIIFFILHFPMLPGTIMKEVPIPVDERLAQDHL